MNAKIVLIPLASLAVIGTAALLHQRTPPAPAPICIQIEDTPEPMVEVESIPTRRFARPPAPPTPPPAAPHVMPVA